jgi:probable rRNA maturation factor
MLDLALNVTPAWPATVDWQALAGRAARAAFAQTPHAELIAKPFLTEVSIKLADDNEVQQLNAAYRGKDRPTNVLSFPMLAPDLIDTATSGDDEELLLGDIILAHETCLHEAQARGIALADHATHLLVHATLHLLGYDHENEVEAIAMEAMEVRALASLGLADPYGDRDGGEPAPADTTRTD